ncbi:hypothetical protein HBN50_14200 [Halobacteriovorax sp. GB3]|uniref:hypothetical protein n=1 Tax=Halobacteriovorax sp. GB3 TaxID=2719615 RepID=UPI00235E2743|nr:hypothetical protein [Halobacteriovorax sp. GB3]MDD0854261.1 hypothetical protein [Halobacteriovorax sp. GB3]
MDWNGATDEQVRNAICVKEVPTLTQMKDELISVDNTLVKKSQVFSYTFENENKFLIDTFRELVTRRAPGRKLVEEELQEDHGQGSECKKVFCALKELFPGDVGLKSAYIRGIYGLNPSPYAFTDKGEHFNDREIDRVLVALLAIPSRMVPLFSGKRINRYLRGVIPGYHRSPNPKEESVVFANASIEFFDPWEKTSDDFMTYVAFHEFGHNFSYEMDLAYSSYWESLSPWGIFDFNQESFVSIYATTNVSEDFAESVATYRYNPWHLYYTSKDKYDFIKYSVFYGAEFTNEKSCDDHTVLDDIEQMIPSDFEISQIQRPLCSAEIGHYLARPNYFTKKDIQNCTKREIVKLALKEKEDELSYLYQDMLGFEVNALSTINISDDLQKNFFQKNTETLITKMTKLLSSKIKNEKCQIEDLRRGGTLDRPYWITDKEQSLAFEKLCRKVVEGKSMSDSELAYSIYQELFKEL